MWLSDLADACRASGLPVAEETGWRARGHGPMVAARGIICHHTAGIRTGNYPSLRVVRDGRPGLPGPLAHLGLARDGTIIVIAAGLAYHAGTGSWPGLSGNSDCIGIEAESVGDGTDWTPAQRAAWPRLCAALARHYGIPARNVIAHREWAPGRKIDPAGIDMPALRASLTTAGSRLPTLDPSEEDDMTPDEYRAAFVALMREAADRSTPTGRQLGDYITRAVTPSVVAGVWGAQVGRGDRRRTLASVLVSAESAALAAAARELGVDVEALASALAGAVGRIDIDEVSAAVAGRLVITPKEQT